MSICDNCNMEFKPKRKPRSKAGRQFCTHKCWREFSTRMKALRQACHVCGAVDATGHLCHRREPVNRGRSATTCPPPGRVLRGHQESHAMPSFAHKRDTQNPPDCKSWRRQIGKMRSMAKRKRGLLEAWRKWSIVKYGCMRSRRDRRMATENRNPTRISTWGELASQYRNSIQQKRRLYTKPWRRRFESWRRNAVSLAKTSRLRQRENLKNSLLSKVSPADSRASHFNLKLQRLTTS